MSELMKLDEFEEIILEYAISHGKVEDSNVRTQLDEILREKQSKDSFWDAYQRTITKLQRKGLIDEKKRPMPRALETVKPDLLRDSLHHAQNRIAELEEEVKRKELEMSQLRNQLYPLQNELTRAREQITKMSPPPPQIIGKDSLERGLPQFAGYDLSGKISEVAKSDLESALKCIYQGIATPAAMVSLRASEDAVRRYYEFKSGQPPGKMTWKEILDKLVERADVNKTLMGHLNFIREKRNEAEHPSKIFSQIEAENTFLAVVNAVREIYSEMK